LDRKFSNTLKHGRRLRQRAFGGLHETDAVLCVSGSDVRTSPDRPKAFRNGQTGSVIAGAVNPQATGKAFQTLVQVDRRAPQDTRAAYSRDVRVDP
jgi:hypothetical protein